MSGPIRVSLSVTTDNPEFVARAAETFGRTAAGLGLDGMEAFLMIGPDEDEE